MEGREVGAILAGAADSFFDVAMFEFDATFEGLETPDLESPDPESPDLEGLELELLGLETPGLEALDWGAGLD